MTLPYIYKFHFTNPFTETATFGYTETTSQQRPLTRFNIDSHGQIKQFTWSPQTEFWNMFWSAPENPCRVYGLCGDLGFCNAKSMVIPCKCLDGFRPFDGVGWDAGDFSGGCRRDGDDGCGENDEFREIGDVTFDEERIETFSGSLSDCERRCLINCSCIALSHNPRTNSCKNLFGKILNLGNSSSDLEVIRDSLDVRVHRGVTGKKIEAKTRVLISVIIGFLAISSMAIVGFILLRKNRIRRRKEEEESVFPVTNLKVFTYKELHAATNGFSDQLGHGGFGAVFSGKVDSTLVAVKRLERPGGGEKEFRAEPENILLDQDFSAKVSDFGLAKLIGRDFSRVLATMRGTWGYVAPEWISGVAITTKADVYSYGMTLLELLGGRRNVEGPPDGGVGGKSNEKWFFPPWAAKRITEGEVAAVVDERLAGEYNVEEVERVGMVAVWCIQDEEAVRPTMGMVVKMLEGVVEVVVPPPPKLLQALVSGESFHGVGGNSHFNDTIPRVSND
ncbi:hypothetical protein L6452_36590 [Arctium lappa]|uniref:Uncharacterized protein n=1 Tax=Arctium lappa TaxID=4217 RepID=A0ACB8YAA0_ARCLA|nr:hypothetical protein L6452_36590 [Arctium lappa]